MPKRKSNVALDPERFVNRNTRVHPAESRRDPATGGVRTPSGLSGVACRHWNYTVQLAHFTATDEHHFIRTHINTRTLARLFADQTHCPTLYAYGRYLSALYSRAPQFASSDAAVDLSLDSDDPSDNSDSEESYGPQSWPENQLGLEQSQSNAFEFATDLPILPEGTFPTLASANKHRVTGLPVYTTIRRGTLYGRLEIGEPECNESLGNIHLQLGWAGRESSDKMSWTAAGYVIRNFWTHNQMTRRRQRMLMTSPPSGYNGYAWRNDCTCFKNNDCVCWPHWFNYCSTKTDKSGLFSSTYLLYGDFSPVQKELIRKVTSKNKTKKKLPYATHNNALALTLQEIRKGDWRSTGEFLFHSEIQMAVTAAKFPGAITQLIDYTRSFNYKKKAGRPRILVWIYGPSGSGKDRFARQYFMDEYKKAHYPDMDWSKFYYEKNSNQKWFEGYEYQPAMILSDLRLKSTEYPEGLEYSRLLQLTDRMDPRSDRKVERKGGSFSYPTEFIIVTTIDEPRLFMAGLSNSMRNDPRQLLRRINLCVTIKNSLEPDGKTNTPLASWRLEVAFKNAPSNDDQTFDTEVNEIPADIAEIISWKP